MLRLAIPLVLVIMLPAALTAAAGPEVAVAVVPGQTAEIPAPPLVSEAWWVETYSSARVAFVDGRLNVYDQGGSILSREVVQPVHRLTFDYEIRYDHAAPVLFAQIVASEDGKVVSYGLYEFGRTGERTVTRSGTAEIVLGVGRDHLNEPWLINQQVGPACGTPGTTLSPWRFGEICKSVPTPVAYGGNLRLHFDSVWSDNSWASSSWVQVWNLQLWRDG